MLQINNSCITTLSPTIIENLLNVTHEVCNMKNICFRTLRALLAFGAVLAVLFSLSSPLAAQFTTASLSGTVTDQSGASVPEAKVTVQNTDTGFTQTVNSGPAGDYLFTRLPIGKYTLRGGKGRSDDLPAIGH